MHAYDNNCVEPSEKEFGLLMSKRDREGELYELQHTGRNKTR